MSLELAALTAQDLHGFLPCQRLNEDRLKQTRQILIRCDVFAVLRWRYGCDERRRGLPQNCLDQAGNPRGPISEEQGQPFQTEYGLRLLRFVEGRPQLFACLPPPAGSEEKTAQIKGHNTLERQSIR